MDGHDMFSLMAEGRKTDGRWICFGMDEVSWMERIDRVLILNPAALRWLRWSWFLEKYTVGPEKQCKQKALSLWAHLHKRQGFLCP